MFDVTETVVIMVLTFMLSYILCGWVCDAIEWWRNRKEKVR